MKNSLFKLSIGFAAGIVTVFILQYFLASPNDSLHSDANGEKKPLYWVAPMDANYRRDKPGKSPMGMDLVPFYGDEGIEVSEGVGTIRISPAVVNNLGVKTAKVSLKPMSSIINTVGYVRYAEDEIQHIHSRVEGWIETLSVKALGDEVVKGQLLYEIYSPSLVSAQQELVLALERNNKGLINAAKDRLRALQISNDFINALIKTKTIKQNIAYFAPKSGFVDNLNIRQGYFVKPDKTMMSISKLDNVWVEVSVFEHQASWLSVGTQASLSVKFLPGKIWKGNIDYIYPKLDEKTRTLKVRLRIENKDHQLKPNMFAQVTFDSQNEENSLLIPKSALIRTGKSNRVVLVAGEGAFKSVNVEVGRMDDEHFEILSGLFEGEEIVVSAQFLLDSESSKTSDFKRMNHSESNIDAFPTATVNGVITSVLPVQRLIEIDREAIKKWDREAANVSYKVDRAISMGNLSAEDKVNFTFEIREGEFFITELIQLPMQ